MIRRVAFIIPYFGKWPEWIDLFFYSCGKNSFIDFFIFSDCAKPGNLSRNVIYKFITWKDYCRLISNALEIEFSPDHRPYKLCDIKPFYGYIHKDLVSNYEFWGFGDIDLCYGNLSGWINERILNKYDVISSHANRLSGHFSLVRNKQSLLNAAFSFRLWRERLKDSKVYGLDEYDFTEYLIPNIKWAHRLHRYIGKLVGIGHYSFFSLVMPLFLINKRYYFKEMFTSPAPMNNEEWTYNLLTGEIYNPAGKELCYLHFLFFKKTPFYDTPVYWKDDYWQVSHGDLTSGKGIIKFTNKNVTYSND